MANKRVGSSIDVVEHLKAEIARKDAALHAVVDAEALRCRNPIEEGIRTAKRRQVVDACRAALREEAP
jgi:hypothetical protein